MATPTASSAVDLPHLHGALAFVEHLFQQLGRGAHRNLDFERARPRRPDGAHEGGAQQGSVAGERRLDRLDDELDRLLVKNLLRKDRAAVPS